MVTHTETLVAHSSETATGLEQHSVKKSVALHLLPGVLILSLVISAGLASR